MPKISEATREARRQRLLDAAWRCLSEKSWQHVTVDDVAAAAGVAKGGFYGYFDSKAELLAALAEADNSDVEERLVLIGEQSSGLERVRRAGKEMLRIASDPARAQLRTDIWAAVAGNDDLRMAARDSTARRRMLLRGWIEDAARNGEIAAVPANALASLLLALLDGLVVHHALDAHGFRWRNVRTALDTLLDGLAAQKLR